MKRLLAYLLIIIGLTFSNGISAVPMKGNGQGNLILTDKILEKLYFYITTRIQNNPLNFFITEDKKNVFSVIRKDTNYRGYSGSGPIARNIKKCESKYKQSCFLFSNQRIIVWNNGINPIDNKKSKIKRKISYNEFITKLNELGFIQTKEQTQIANVESAVKTKKKKKVKVAKIEEPKQEKLKPKKTNKQSKTKITKKIIKSDASDLKVKDISTWEKKVIAAIEKERSDPYCKLVDKKPKLNELKFKKNYCIKKSDILKLGKYKRFNTPEFLLTEMKGCKSNTCLADNAGKNVYKIFVQKTPIYHAKYPGDMIKGMAWFEILYQTKLKKLQKTLKRYDEQNYKGFWKLKKRVHESEIYSLIKLNRGRVKMRNALGFTLYDDMYEVIEGQWLLAEFLNKDKLKISKVKMTPEMFKRKELIEKYKTVLAKYKKKLDEEKDKKLN